VHGPASASAKLWLRSSPSLTSCSLTEPSRPSFCRACHRVFCGTPRVKEAESEPHPGSRTAYDESLPRSFLINHIIVASIHASFSVRLETTDIPLRTGQQESSCTMSYSSGFQAPGSWEWPDDLPNSDPSHAESSTSSSQQQPSSSPSGQAPSTGTGSQSRRAHWPPRQCRICLETVQPTFNAASESLPSFLQSPNVVYEDEGGRLLRPCKCKGSSKYVHDACLQAWRHADPSYGRRNYWQCPTCGFKYRMARLGVGRFIGSIGKFPLFPTDNKAC
jgi:hypothetical protein